jgi:hypothetical protein
MTNSVDTLELILIVILVITLWAGLVVAIRLPRMETVLRGVYDELKRVYDELERRNQR